MELLTKLKEASKVPDHAVRKVRGTLGARLRVLGWNSGMFGGGNVCR
jgi:hypothetical protein